MTVEEIILALQAYGVSFSMSGEAVRLIIPPGFTIPPDVIQMARAAKADIRAFLKAEVASSKPIRIDTADPDERAALVEHDGLVPRLYVDEFARLQQTCPPGVPLPRWRQFISDGGVVLDCWGRTAMRLGWRVSDLFGFDPDVPLARYDRLGLVWLLRGRTVVEVNAAYAILSGGLRYYRHH